MTYEDWTCEELKREILFRLGANEPAYTGLSKRSMNSLVAYFTGELPERPASLYTGDAATLAEMRETVAEQASVTSWLLDDRDRRFRRDELADVLRAMGEIQDQREWAESPGTIE